MFKGLKVILAGAVVMAAYAVPAMAGDREFADIYTECGLGAMIAPRNEAVAAVTNVTWDSGTTAITSNISSPSTCKGGQERTAAFLNESYKPLESDLASGHGAYLDTLMQLVGVDAKAQPQYAEALRADFAKLVAQPGYSKQTQFEKSQALYNLVYKHTTVS